MEISVFRENRVVGLLAVAGLVLRLAALRGSLWYDEAFSVWLAGLPLDRLIQATIYDVHPPAYYLFLWGICRAFGNSEVAIRMPSLLAGMALIFVVYRLAGRVGLSPPARLMTAGMVALMPFQIYYSTEARSYSFQMLAVSLAAVGLLERRWWLLVAGSLVALYLQHTSALFILALFVAAAIAKNGDACRQVSPQPAMRADIAKSSDAPALFYCGVVIGLVYLPGLALAGYQSIQVGSGYWILPVDNPGRIMDTLDSLLFYTPNNPFFLSSLVSGLGAVLILADIRRWGEQRFIMTMALLPLLLVVSLSLAWQSILIARILAPSAPFLYMAIADSVCRSPRRVVVWGGAAAAFIVCINGAVLIGTAGRTMDDYYTIPGYQAGDGIYHTNAGSIVLWHYYVPTAEQVLWRQDNHLSENLTTDTKIAMGMKQGDFDRIACRHKRWWYISMHNPTSSPEELAHARHILEQYHGREIKILRLDRLVDSRVYLIEPGCSEQDIKVVF